MTWLVNQLNRRILFLKQEQTPTSEGGAQQTYKQLARVWAGLETTGTSSASYVRNVQVEDAPTHKFTVRRSVQAGVCVEGTGFVKSDNFVFLLSSNTPTSGRLFRILTAHNVGEADEYVEFLAKEMESLDTTRGIIK